MKFWIDLAELDPSTIEIELGYIYSKNIHKKSLILIIKFHKILEKNGKYIVNYLNIMFHESLSCFC